MVSNSVSAIWFGKFDNKKQLKDYLKWNYKTDNPKCKFADELGVSFFDEDFLESYFASSYQMLIEQIDDISFIEYFKDQLLSSIKKISGSDQNSIIVLTGNKDKFGSVNDFLFNYKPMNESHSNLQLVGIYEFHENE